MPFYHGVWNTSREVELVGKSKEVLVTSGQGGTPKLPSSDDEHIGKLSEIYLSHNFATGSIPGLELSSGLAVRRSLDPSMETLFHALKASAKPLDILYWYLSCGDW